MTDSYEIKKNTNSTNSTNSTIHTIVNINSRDLLSVQLSWQQLKLLKHK